ncbi:MAG: hypothetical protein RR243_13275 [Citrobacter sp.]
MQRVANFRTVVKQATVTLLITRQYMKQQQRLVRRTLLAFTPDGDVGNCLLQGFTGSH